MVGVPNDDDDDDELDDDEADEDVDELTPPPPAAASNGSTLLVRLPCLELLCTNMLSDMASSGPSTLICVAKTT